MKVYRVSDGYGESEYFKSRKNAERHFKQCVTEGITGRAVTLEKGSVELNAETVLRLLNGQGGYWVEEEVLKITESK